VYADQSLFTEVLFDRYRALSLAPGNRQAFVDRARTRDDWPFARIADVAAPTLLMWGEQDTWTPFEDAEAYTEAFANARLISYPDAGHVPMEEIPGRSARDARRFLLAPDSTVAVRRSGP
jgi:pimeloyl-ACP methyl ester carboxylesterase